MSILIRGWADKLHRTRATNAELDTTGLTFDNPGGPPRSVTMEFVCTSSANLGRKNKRLSLELLDDAALKMIFTTIADYLARKPPQ